MALKHNHRLHQAEATFDESEARRKSARGRLGPTLSVDASINVWNETREISFGPTPTTLRDQVTGQISITLAQPISMQLVKGHEIARLDRDAIGFDTQKQHDLTIFETIRTYLQLKQSIASHEIAETAVSQLKAQLEQGTAFYNAGTIDKNDLLKIELALAEAETTLIQAQSQVSVAQSALALLIGISSSEAIDANQSFSDPPSSFTQSLESCTARALEQRRELKSTDTRLRLAQTSRDMVRWDFFPQLVALANYQHVQGQGMFAAKNAFFFGGTLKWNVWEWGKTYFSLQEANHKLRGAEAARMQLETNIVLDVKQNFLNLDVATKTLRVAKTRIIQAEEAYRIDQLKYAAGSTTTKDLLDAQLMLTRAKLSAISTLYTWYLARTALALAMGDPLPIEALTGNNP